MNTKRNKIIYWSVTGIFTAFLLMSITMYYFNHDMVTDAFTKLGYGGYLVYPLATVKLLGLTAIITKKSKLLKEWAYAGFFFCFSLAALAHTMAGDGGASGAFVAMGLLIISYIFDRKVFGEPKAILQTK